MRIWLFALLSVVLLISCSQPKSPSLRSERAEVLDHDKTGMVVRVHASAHNPNGFAIPVKGGRGTLFVEGVNTGDAVVRSVSTLAPHADTPVEIDVQVPWKTVAYAVGKARPEQIVRYRFEGAVVFEIANRRVEVPVEQTGEVDKKKVFLAAVRHIGLPKDLTGR